jgi:hypothetical protein
MTSYLLDTTSNALVTYGQGKYVASASGDVAPFELAYIAFNKVSGDRATLTNNYSATTGVYGGSVTTVDTLGNSYPGDWLQIQMPVTIIMTAYTLYGYSPELTRSPKNFQILGSRDGINWTLVDSRSGVTGWTTSGFSFTTSITQAYSYFRMVISANNINLWLSIGEWILNGTEEGICVTNDSKVGVGIANPQRALEVAGDLVVSGTISGGAGMGAFRNRIINGDMRIAQRGTSNVLAGSIAVNSYLIDRFCVSENITTGSITQLQSSLAASDTPYQVGFRNYMNVYVNSACTNFGYIQPSQFIEGYNLQDLNWGTSYGSPITLSFWFRTNVSGGVFNVAINQYGVGTNNYVATFSPLQGAWQYFTFTIPPPPNGTSWGTGTGGNITLYIGGLSSGLISTVNAWNASSVVSAYGSTNWFLTAGNFINFTGVQLEKGTVATGFEQRPFAQELALCQRYYYQMSAALSASHVLGTGYAGSSSIAYIMIQHPVAMRVQPTSVSNSAVSTFQVGYLATATTVTGIAAGALGPYGSGLNISTAPVLTAGQGVNMTATSSSAFLGFNAEL